MSGLVATKVTLLTGRSALLAGGGVRVLSPSRTTAIGVTGYGSIRPSSRLESPSFRYVGAEAAWTGWPDAPIHPVLGGVAAVALATERLPARRSTALLAEPAALVEAAISRSIRVAAGATWRQALCLRCAGGLGVRALSGPSAELQVRFVGF